MYDNKTLGLVKEETYRGEDVIVTLPNSVIYIVFRRTKYYYYPLSMMASIRRGKYSSCFHSHCYKHVDLPVDKMKLSDATF